MSGDDSDNAIPQNGVLLHKIVVSGSTLGYESDFEYNGNYLVKQTAVGLNGVYDTYVYTGNLITGISHFSDNAVFSIEQFEYDAQERLVVRRVMGASSDDATRTTYVYDDTGETVMVTTFTGTLAQQNTLYRKMKVYLEDESPVKTEKFDINTDAITQTQTFVYDDKGCPYTGINGFLKLKWYDNFLIGPHNYTTMTTQAQGQSSVDTDTVEYVYNPFNLPAQGTYDNDGSVLVFQYFYQ